MALTDEQKKKIEELALQNTSQDKISKEVSAKPGQIYNFLQILRKANPAVDKILTERAAKYPFFRYKKGGGKMSVNRPEERPEVKVEIDVDELASKIVKALGTAEEEHKRQEEAKRREQDELARKANIELLREKTEKLEKTIGEINTKIPEDFCQKWPEICKAYETQVKKTAEEAPQPAAHRSVKEFMDCPECNPKFWLEFRNRLVKQCENDPETCKAMTETIKAHPEKFPDLIFKEEKRSIF